MIGTHRDLQLPPVLHQNRPEGFNRLGIRSSSRRRLTSSIASSAGGGRAAVPSPGDRLLIDGRVREAVSGVDDRGQRLQHNPR